MSGSSAIPKYREIASKYLKNYKPTPFDWGRASKLPEEYRKFWKEWRETTPEPVHYVPEEGNWKRMETGEMKRIENIPLPGRIPKELNQVITGGEMVIQGFKKKGKYVQRIPHFWVPAVRRSAIYSEVLDKHISVLITQRAICLINEHQSFDKYVLKTKACDLGTEIALKLKRKILLALRDKNLPYDEEKNSVIYEKYKEYLLPPEEIEWYGLTLSEAVRKYEKELEEENARNVVPLKHVLRASLFRHLKEQEGKQ